MGQVEICRQSFMLRGSRGLGLFAVVGPAPEGATINHYRDELGLNLIPGTGLLATAVPGAVDGYLLILRDYGVLDIADVLAPAIYYAEHGAPVVPNICKTIAGVEELFCKHWLTSKLIYMPDGKIPTPGSLLGNKGLAKTWTRLISEAKSAAGDRQNKLKLHETHGAMVLLLRR